MLKNTPPPHLDKLTLSRYDSESINLLKVLLIVLVVFIHILPDYIYPIPRDYTQDIFPFRLISELISHSLGRIAVPAFFLISGYFFFYQKTLSFDTYKSALLKRLPSLLIPYLLWNILYYLLIVGKVALSTKYGLEVHRDEFIKLSTPLYQHLIEPIDYPLWYVRDLICMVLVSPIMYYGVKKLHIYFVGSLYLNYLFGWGCIGFSQVALFYFGLGVYLCLRGANIVSLSKCKGLTIGLSVLGGLLLGFTLWHNQAPYSEYLIKLYIPLFLPLLLHLSSYLYGKMSIVWAGGVQCLGRYVFFIYAMHTVFVLSLVRAFLMRIGLPLESLGNYFLTGFMTILLCVLLYELAGMVLPKKVMSLLTGGR